MSYYIGFDIGGTKLAAALFDADFNELGRRVTPSSRDYNLLLKSCGEFVAELDAVCGEKPSIGVGIPGAADHNSGLVYHAANLPAIIGQSLGPDLRRMLDRQVIVANDADCAALSEAVLGAGKGYRTVFGVIMGTGVGGGMITDGRPIYGAHGMAGEIGHLPLPFRENADGPVVPCNCGQHGCIDKTISGPALLRLYQSITGQTIAEGTQIVGRMEQGDAGAKKTLDQFYRTVAKAFVTIIHAYDPEMIVISGGLTKLPGLYDAVPKLLGEYSVVKQPHVKIVPALHGSMSGLRGAALLAR